MGVALLASGLLFGGLALRHPQSLKGGNLLLITIDTLRADALGCYGNRRVETPWIDRLAAQGVRFDRARAHSVVTLSSHSNILSGLYPNVHGVRDNSGFRFPEGTPTLATILKERGYRTGAFVSGFPLDSRFGLNRGFDIYDDHFGDFEASPAFHMEERRGSQTVAAALRWLAEARPEPYFCWVHLYEPHAPYEPPEPWATRFRDDAYHGEVSAADGALGPLLEPILTEGSKGKTLVVLTADHGESLGAHGEATHGTFAYEPTLRVPLVLYAPQLVRPRVNEAAARHIDILPTVLAALGVPRPDGLPGVSLLEVARGGSAAPSGSCYFESLSPLLTRGWAPLYGVVSGEQKYIDLPIPELYDLAVDPGETKNLAASKPEEVDRLRDLLRQLRSPDRGLEPSGETAEVRERLKSLGYTTASQAVFKEHYTAEDDPKRLIGLSSALDEVLALYHSGEIERARALCEDIVKKRPMPVALLQLAFLRRASGDLAGAVEAAREALELNPKSVDSAALLGVYLNESGKPQETLRRLAPYAERRDPDVDVLFSVGAAQAQLGHKAEALATFERARSLEPTSAMVLVNMGTVYLMSKDYGAARSALEKALALEPNLSRAYNSLGVIEAEGGHPDAAIDLWKKAVELNPSEYDTLFNLGELLVRRGRRSEARGYYEAFEQRAPPALYARDLAWVRKWLSTAGSAPASR